ncbi:MAG: oligoendopeptidase F family protein [Candidatus Delongbacteria bacterium]|nr:oligoendopeptidase F family protein [Candidatus Delongbacteria bacterium]MBN2834349.1 oligoendopeptidase F family protein [Candidatus Delongbacteria bacterium]
MKIIMIFLLYALSNLICQTEFEDLKYNTNWNLSIIYRSWDDWANDFNEMKNKESELSIHKGTLNNPENFIQLMNMKEEFIVKATKLYSYAMLKQILNANDQDAVSKSQEIGMYLSKLEQITSWIEPEIISNVDIIINYIASRNDYKYYEHFLQDLKRSKNHILNEEQNIIVSEFDKTFTSLSNLYNITTIADRKYDEIIDTDGNKQILNTQFLVKTLESNPSQSFRFEAFDKYFRFYFDNKNLFSEIYRGILSERSAFSKLSGFNSSLESALYSDNIPESILNNYIVSAKNSRSDYSKYIDLRRKYLKLDSLMVSDMSFSVNNNQKIYSFEEAKYIIRKSLKPLGSDYIKKVDFAFNSGLIDLFPATGKKSGAATISIQTVAPFMYTNFAGSLGDIFTLTHELGHVIHNIYTLENQPLIYTSPSPFTSEVASIMNEQLLVNYLINDAESGAEVLEVVVTEIQNLTRKYFRMAQLTEFEIFAHELADSDKPINCEILANKYSEIEKDYTNGVLISNGVEKYGWASVQHLFNHYFYLYQYATSFAASAFISEKILDGESDYLDNYIKFLKSGSSDYPVNILKNAGVDLTKQESFEYVNLKFSNLIKKLEIELNRKM